MKFTNDIFFSYSFSINFDSILPSINKKLSRNIEKEIRWLPFPFFFSQKFIRYYYLSIYYFLKFIMIIFYLIHFPLISMIRFYINFEKLSDRRALEIPEKEIRWLSFPFFLSRKFIRFCYSSNNDISRGREFLLLHHSALPRPRVIYVTVNLPGRPRVMATRVPREIN